MLSVLLAVRSTFDTESLITTICIIAVLWLCFVIVCAILIKRTQRFYRLGKDTSYPIVSLRKAVQSKRKDIEISFFAGSEEDALSYIVSDAADEFYVCPGLTQEQQDKLADGKFALCDKLNKIYSYQEFALCDLAFFHGKKILCEKELAYQLFKNSPVLPNGNT